MELIKLLAGVVGPLAHLPEPGRLAACAFQSQHSQQHAQQGVDVPIWRSSLSDYLGQILAELPMREARVLATSTLETLIVLTAAARCAQLAHATPSEEKLIGKLGDAAKIRIRVHGSQQRPCKEEAIALTLGDDAPSSSARRLHCASLGA